MSSWKIEYKTKLPKLNKPVLIEGLPGIGNVGKVAVDFLVEGLEAKKICEFYSFNFPHSVFITENNLVSLPTISLYYKKNKKNDLLFLAGDIQPIDEFSCYEFCHLILDMLNKNKATEIITLGGIGLMEPPKFPKVYCTANSKKIIKEYKSLKGVKINNNLYGVVGPIIGVSGIMVGLASKYKIPAIAFLAETYGHPMYLGIKGAKEIMKVLIKRFSLKVNIKDLEKEIEGLEKELLKKTTEISKMQKGKFGQDEVNYIG